MMLPVVLPVPGMYYFCALPHFLFSFLFVRFRIMVYICVLLRISDSIWTLGPSVVDFK